MTKGDRSLGGQSSSVGGNVILESTALRCELEDCVWVSPTGAKAVSAVALPSVALIIPVFNEEKRLPSLLKRLQSAEQTLARAGLDLVEVIIVDDGSTDSTAVMLEGVDSIRVRSTQHEGKGFAVRAGVLVAQAQFVLITDCDLSTPLEDAARLVRAVTDGCQIAIGSRALGSSRILVHQPLYREWMGKTFNTLVRCLTRLPYHDTQCGFKLLRLDVAQELFSGLRTRGFAYDVEILARAQRAGFRVTEVPVQWSDKPGTRVDLITAPAQMLIDLAWILLHLHRR